MHNSNLVVMAMSLLLAGNLAWTAEVGAKPKCTGIPTLSAPLSSRSDDIFPESTDNVEGTVVIELTITLEGLTESPTIISSSNPQLNVSALSTVARLKFKRPLLACRARIPVTYKLKRSN
jgi:TonB family protein